MTKKIVIATAFCVGLFFNFYVLGLDKCDDTAELYLLEDQIVQVTHYKKSLSIVPCMNVSYIKVPLFDPILVLSGVEQLQVKNVFRWPPLPDLTSLKVVTFDSVTPVGEFGVCKILKRLTLRNLTNATSGYLSNCKRVFDLQIIDTNIMQAHMILKDIPDVITELTLSDIEGIKLIEEYPLFLNKSAFHRLDTIYITFFDVKFYTYLETRWNKVSSALAWQFSLLPNLKILYIENFPVFDMCAKGMFPSGTFRSLKKLGLYFTNTTEVCFKNYHATPQLDALVIEGSPFNNIDFSELFSARRELKVTIDYVRSFKFSRHDYLALGLGPRITMKGFRLTIDCSCDSEALWLLRAISEDIVVAADLMCSNDHKPFENQICERLDCNRLVCQSSSVCVCCRVGPHDAFGAVCRDANLTALPDEFLRMRNLTQLIVPNNQISSLPDKLPETLLRLDLSGNQIRQLNASEALVLFQVPTRKVRLAGNPLICNTDSCYNRPLLDALQIPKNQVEDSVECIGEAKMLGKLPEVCESQLAKQREILLITTVVLIVILATMSLLALYYRQTIKIFLFARGWCLCWLREDELDEDRHYDVFLSFCHVDVQIVLDQLLPILDQEYSVCVHLRDWMPGEMIPTQILRSVEQSRRTVVVVSNSYAKSLWGLLEFRTAYASGLSEGRIRVVMIVLDDVLESEDLNGELKQYIRFNTYVRWGDPWFWSKLRYALPHKPRQTTKTKQDTRFEEPSLRIAMLYEGSSQPAHEHSSGI